MRKSLLLIASFICVQITLVAQTKGKISGMIKDGMDISIQSATITLVKANDSSSLPFALVKHQNKIDHYAAVTVLPRISKTG